MRTVTVLISLAVLIGLAVVYSGAFNVAATEPHTALGRWLFSTTMVQSVRAHAGDIEVPELTPDMAREGFRHYEAQCRLCHGAPGVQPGHVGQGLRPMPPELSATIDRWDAAEAFWIVKHGVRMTGMPAWGLHYSDDQIWSTVAFIRQLPQMSAADYQARVQAMEETSSTGDAEASARTVEMTDDLRFTPATIRIRAGESVTWNNTSSLVHTVTADPERASDPEHVVLPEAAEPFHSGDLAPGESFSREFSTPGRYRYFCVPHEAAGMVGELIVTE